ncbi:DNA damage-binding protein CMR1 [Linum grandiflorum]
MAPQAKNKMTEYERKRLENIRRNHEKMAALKVHSKASQLSESSKRQRVADGQSKSFKRTPDTKSKPDSPVIIRRSLRTRGMEPQGIDGGAVIDDPLSKTLTYSAPKKTSLRVLGPLSMNDAYDGAGSNRTLVATLLSIDKKPQVSLPLVKEDFEGGDVVKKEELGDGVSLNSVKVEKSEGCDGGDVVKKEQFGNGISFNSLKVEQIADSDSYCIKEEKKEIESILDLGSMKLEPANVARVVSERVMNVKFLPCNDVRMVVVGNKLGNVGFWNMDSEDDDQGICLYRPHTGPISGIIFQESCFSKIYTSCYDGYIRLMDAEKQVFNLVHYTEETVFCLSRRPNDDKSLYFGEGFGGLTVWDEKMGKTSAQWYPHEHRINTIDFNPRNPNLMATSSTDGTARIWDLRYVRSNKQPKCLKMVSHNRAVRSAYFSPSGNSLATASVDDNVGIHSGVNYEDNYMIPHNNQTSRWMSAFRAIWGWDDSYIFIGNMNRGVDVISSVQRRTVTTLKSPEMTAIPCRFDAHPYQVGMLAGATTGGQVYVWTSS